jgi:hypothetical protein
MKKYKLALCRFPGSGWEHHGLTTWLMKTFHEMKQDATIEGILIQVYSDTPITMTRNRAVKEALAAECDYILMVDSDMVPDYLVGRDNVSKPFWKTAWGFMWDRREQEENYRNDLSQSGGKDNTFQLYPPATIAAPYCGPPPDECVYIFKWEDFESDSPDWNYKLKMFERQEAYRFSGIGPVAAMGTGLILYDARVFRTLPPPWYDYEWVDTERTDKASTEDVYQTRNASMLHLPQFCAWDSWALHVKPKYVKKPGMITSDMVHSSLVEAVKRGHNRNESVRFVGEGSHLDPKAAMVEAANAYAVKVGQQAHEAHLAKFHGDR